MRKRMQMLRLPPEARAVWMTFALTALGCCIGLLSLMYSAAACLSLDGWALFGAYLSSPLHLLLNLLPVVLLIWLFYFLTGRSWAAFGVTYLLVIGLSVANYYKIRLRADPLLASDLLLTAEAGNMVQGYTLDVTWVTWAVPGCLLIGLLFTWLLMPARPDHARTRRIWRERVLGAASCFALFLVSIPAMYTNTRFYYDLNLEGINYWSDVESFVSRGGVYSFLHSVRGMLPVVPEGYSAKEAAALLEQYPDADIPEEKKVSVVGIMLEAFCDLSDLPGASALEAVVDVYEPWHELERRAVSGDLLTNIFAGGTVDTEWGFLTGYSTHSQFRGPVDSYVWYFRSQDYQTFGGHPGHDWFYNRNNINQRLGFQEYWFSENHYSALVAVESAIYRSDRVLVAEILSQLRERVQKGPCFSFSVSLQNHGPYETEETIYETYLTPRDSGCSQANCNIWNNYLSGVSETIQAMLELTQGLEEMEEPVVLVLFGDHKPWGGNGNLAYLDLMGGDFDLSDGQGFYRYYATPYLIWANPAAKAVLGRTFTGDGGDFSPCFLMEEVFSQCGWTGPGFMQLSRQARQVTPLLHAQGLYWRDGLTDVLPDEDAERLREFLCAQFYRERAATPEPLEEETGFPAGSGE